MTRRVILLVLSVLLYSVTMMLVIVFGYTITIKYGVYIGVLVGILGVSIAVLALLGARKGAEGVDEKILEKGETVAERATLRRIVDLREFRELSPEEGTSLIVDATSGVIYCQRTNKQGLTLTPLCRDDGCPKNIRDYSDIPEIQRWIEENMA